MHCTPPAAPVSPHHPLSTMPSSSSSSTATSTTQACAACKYQRRKCQPNCILASYFPADQQCSFLNAHRLFGVSNILRTLRSLDPSLHPPAMHSIIFHSNSRAQDPVLGCCRIIRDLHRAIAMTAAELQFVLRQLALYRGDDASVVSTGLLPPPLPFFNAHEDAVLLEQCSNYFDHNAIVDGNIIGNCSGSVVDHAHGDGNGNGSSASSIGVLGSSGDLLAADVLFDVENHPFLEEDNKIAGNTFHCSNNNFNIISNNINSNVELKEEPVSIENELRGAASLFTLSS